MRNPVYRGDSRWTANRNRKKKEELANSAKGAKKMTSYFPVRDLIDGQMIGGLLAKQIMPKRARSPSPDQTLLSESEILMEDLDVEGNENFDAIAQAAADDEQTNFYLEQLEKELTGTFWVLEEEADDLYGVSNIANNSELSLTDCTSPKGIC
jgi:hypothetical protein